MTVEAAKIKKIIYKTKDEMDDIITRTRGRKAILQAIEVHYGIDQDSPSIPSQVWVLATVWIPVPERRERDVRVFSISSTGARISDKSTVFDVEKEQIKQLEGFLRMLNVEM